MDISQINSDTASVAAASRNPGKTDLGKDDFLQLLVTQLRNQDPTNPMKSQEFASQLAQFNSLEQLINVNSGLEELAASQESTSTGMINTLASTLTGKQVKVQTNQLSLGAEGGTPVNFDLAKDAPTVELKIYDASGNEVRSVTLANQSEGGNSWQWDGKSNSGSRLPEGEYSVEVNAGDGETSIDGFAFLKGNVDKVKYSSDGIKLQVNGVYVGMGQVEEISEGNSEE